jgi:hypothetical protein
MFRSLLSTLKLAPPQSKGLLKELENADVFTIAATQSEGIDAGALGQERLAAEIRKQMDRDREAQKDERKLFTYKTKSGEIRLPFFTTAENAQRFCAEYSKEHKKVYPFVVLQAKARFLGRVSPESCHVVVMDDKTPDERILTAAEMGLAQRLWG